MDRDAEIKRIQKLLNLGNGSNFSAEAEQALRRAAELMSKNGFSEIDLKEASLDEDLGKIDQEDIGTKQYRSWEVTLLTALKGLFDCSLIRFSGPVYGKKSKLVVVGRESKRRTCIAMFLWLRDRTLLESKKISKIKSFRNDYCSGFAYGISKLVNGLLQERKKTVSYGLVPINEVDKWISENIKDCGHLDRTLKFSARSESYLDGFYRGKETNLNRQFGLKAIGC